MSSVKLEKRGVGSGERRVWWHGDWLTGIRPLARMGASVDSKEKTSERTRS